MRCLYCGKELALFKRLRGGEFCSDAHRQRYQEEYTQLALNRLLQANAPKDNENNDNGKTEGEKEGRDARPGDSGSPALKRREKAGREDSPASPVPAKPAKAAVPVLTAPTTAPGPFTTVPPAPAMTPVPLSMAAQQTAVLEPEAATAPAALDRSGDPEPSGYLDPSPGLDPAELLKTAGAGEIDEPAPAGMSSFLVECPVPAVSDAPGPVHTPEHLSPATVLTLPRLGEFQPDLDAAHLDPAERVMLSLFAVADFPSPPRERGVELREFVRGVHQVEIHVKPAVESGFEPVKEALAVELETMPPDGSPSLWLEPPVELSTGKTEILLGELARLDFALTAWGDTEGSAEGSSDGSAEVEIEPAGESAKLGKPSVLAARIEPARVEPAQNEPAPLASSRPEPVRFEPVHIDPVFMQRIAQTAAEPTSLEVEQDDPPPPAEQEPIAQEPVALSAPEPVTNAAEEAPQPATITQPLPVTLHGLAPLRGKPVQVFTLALARTGGLQIPFDTGLPLRPIMILGPAPKPAAVEPSLERSAPTARAIPVPEKSEQADGKPRRSEVRVLPVQMKQQVRPEAVKQPASKPESNKPEAVKAEPVKAAPNGPQPVKETSAPAARLKGTPARPSDIKPADVKPADVKPPAEAKSAPPTRPLDRASEAPRSNRAPVETRPPAPTSGPAKPRVSPAEKLGPPEKPAPVEKPVPAEEPLDLLGLPKLSFQQKETFWSKLPGAVRLGVIAAALALIIGGVVLTSRGSGSAKPAAVAPREPEYVEDPALATTAGWIQDWFADRAGGKQGRHVDVLRGSLTARDYRLLFEGQIERGALGWVFRADEKSFYVEKIQVLTPGRDPVVALVRFAVINGVEQPRVQVPLNLQAHLDTLYKVRMDIVGDKFTTWLQDEKVDQWTDNQIAVGGVGLYYDSGDSAKLRDTLNVIPLRRK